MRKMKIKTGLTGILCAASLLTGSMFAAVSGPAMLAMASEPATISVSDSDAPDADAHGELGKWYVHFTRNETMDDNLTSGFYEPLQNMQPGDSAYFEVSIRNDHPDVTDWYLDNEIVRSLEDYDNNIATNGGAYSYKLEFFGPDGQSYELYRSDTLGGDDATTDGAVGLHQAAENLGAEQLQDFTWLARLSNGQGGKVRLTVALDGETQGNDYQYTMAQVRIRFAVNLHQTATEKKETKIKRTVVKTGDEFNMWPYFAAAFFAGMLLLLICIFRVKDRKKGGRRQGGTPNA